MTVKQTRVENQAVNAEGSPLMDLQAIEARFDGLADITDRVAMVNTPYDVDLDAAIDEMHAFIDEATGWNPNHMTDDTLRVYLSHTSFHREIVAEIIAEARRVLLDERRDQVKRLVQYHKQFTRWLAALEKRYAA